MKIKKILVFLLIALCAPLLFACGDGDVVGVWKFDKIVCSVNGAEYSYNIEQISALEYKQDVADDDIIGQIENNLFYMKTMVQDYCVSVKSDHTCLLSYSNSTYSGTWKRENSKVYFSLENQVEGNENYYVLKDEALCITNTYDNITYTFVLTK